MKLYQHGPNRHGLIIDHDTEVLFSYETPVLLMTEEGVVRTNQFFSKSTSRHINQFLSHHDFPDGYVKEVTQVELEDQIQDLFFN